MGFGFFLLFIIIPEIWVRRRGGSGQDPGGASPSPGVSAGGLRGAEQKNPNESPQKRGVGAPSVQRGTPRVPLLREMVVSAAVLGVATWGEPAGRTGTKHQRNQKGFVAFAVSCFFRCFEQHWGFEAPARLWLELTALQEAGPAWVGGLRGSGSPPRYLWAQWGQRLWPQPGHAAGTRSLRCRDGGWFQGLPREGSANLGFIPPKSRSHASGLVCDSGSSAESGKLVSLWLTPCQFLGLLYIEFQPCRLQGGLFVMDAAARGISKRRWLPRAFAKATRRW